MTLPLIALIGLDPPLEEAVRHSMYGQARFLTYPMPPQGFSLDGQMRLEHPRLANLWAEPAGVIYHGYFDDVTDFRKALALSSTPCYPAMAPTLPHDDRAASLALARWIDKQEDQVGRGFVPVIAGGAVLLRDSVGKRGSSHCGEDKIRLAEGAQANGPLLVEPFIDGESIRVLYMRGGPTGNPADTSYWGIRYESPDWRKNVGGTARVDQSILTWGLLDRTHTLCSRLGLDMAGVDYILRKDGPPVLLEVNAYPGLDGILADGIDSPELVFVAMAKQTLLKV